MKWYKFTPGLKAYMLAALVISLLWPVIYAPSTSAAYSTASSNPDERSYAYLLEAKELLLKELTYSPGSQPPSDAFRGAVRTLLRECDGLRRMAEQGKHTFPPPDLAALKQACMLPDPVSESGAKVQENARNLQSAQNELKRVLEVRKGLERWLNTDFQNRVGESIKKITGILTSGGTTTLADFAKEVVGMTADMIRADQPQFPDTSDFVRKHSAEMTREMEAFIAGLKSKYPDQDLDSIQRRLQRGESLSYQERSFLNTVMYRSAVTATEISGREVRRYQSSIIPQLQYEKTLLEKESGESRRRANNLALYRALCNELNGCSGWTQSAGSPKLQVRMTASAATVKPGTVVEYRYEVANTGNVPLSQVTIADDHCPDIKGVSGDINRNKILDQQELWVFRCSATVQTTTTNTATVTAAGPAGGRVQAKVSVTVHGDADMTTVPSVIGLEKATADYDIQGARLKTGSVRTEQSTQRAGVVISQTPPAGTKVPPGTTVNLVISGAAPAVAHTLYVDPKSKTMEVNQRLQLRALLWFPDGHEEDVTAKVTWMGAERGLFTAQAPGQFRVVATYGEMSANAAITVREPLPPAWTPPMSHADDIGARAEPAPASAYTWYALCDKSSGTVTYGERPHISQHVMAGPFEGPRTAKWWIDQNCPKWRCASNGLCAREPARGGNWNVLCDKQMGILVLGTNYDYGRHYPLQRGFLGEPDARTWTNANCPSWRCDRDGRCIQSTAPGTASSATPSGVDNCVNKYCPQCARSIDLLGVTVRECEECKKRFAAQINACRGQQASAAAPQPPSGAQSGAGTTLQTPHPQTQPPPRVPAPAAPRMTTATWAGTWTCKEPRYPAMRLTISGNGMGSSLRAAYVGAYGGKPAQDQYTIERMSATSAQGRYIYRDANPARGPLGRPGEWTGRWSIEIAGNGLRLYRKDDASSWSGSYACWR